MTCVVFLVNELLQGRSLVGMLKGLLAGDLYIGKIFYILVPMRILKETKGL